MEPNAQKTNLVRLDARPIIVASHPRSGTHLVLDTLRRQFRDCRSWKWPGERLDRLYFNIDSLLDSSTPSLSEPQAIRILGRARRPLIKTHALPGLANWFRAQQLRPPPPEWLEWLSRHAETCYVLRDGRAVLCSYHQYVRGFDPSAPASLSDFMRQTRDGISRVRAWADHVRAWRAQPQVLVLRFEDLLGQPEATLAMIAERFGMTPRWVTPLTPKRSRNLLEGRVARILSIRPESSAILGGGGGEKPPPWPEAFRPEDRAFFHRETGNLLIELGYETSSDWVSDG
jgi:hypothetical protein